MSNDLSAYRRHRCIWLVTSLMIIPPKLCATNIIGFIFLSSDFRDIMRSLACCDTLLMSGPLSNPPMTPALYPYVMILALGISLGSSFSGQKIDFRSLEASSSVSETRAAVASRCLSCFPDLRFQKRNTRLLFCGRLLARWAILSGGNFFSQVHLGSPRSPWIKTMLTALLIHAERHTREGRKHTLLPGLVRLQPAQSNRAF